MCVFIVQLNRTMYIFSYYIDLTDLFVRVHVNSEFRLRLSKTVSYLKFRQFSSQQHVPIWWCPIFDLNKQLKIAAYTNKIRALVLY